MSAFFFALNRDGQAFSERLAERMHQQLERFAEHGSRLIVQENFAIGYQSHWTVPEEQGEQQPLQLKEQGLWLVFHGRIDNRAELLASLERHSPAAQGNDSLELSDAQLLLALLQAHGQQVLASIVGPFVFVCFDQRKQSLLAARDAMGGRYLVFHCSENLLVFATYEMALAAHPSIGYQLREGKAARLLANVVDYTPESLLKSMQPLHPGQQISLQKKGRLDISTFYLPSPSQRIDNLSDQVLATEFRRLLDQAVRRRMRGLSAIGVMLSGGLDSVPIAISAATLNRSSLTSAKPVEAFSWVFDEHPSADERHYSAPLCERLGLRSNWVKCDALWPTFDDAMHCNPIVPFSTPYSAFTQALLAQAHQRDISVLLSGMGGDMLYSGIDTLLRELVRTKGWRAAVTEAWRIFHAMPSARQFLRKFIFNAWGSSSLPVQVMPDWMPTPMAEHAIQSEHYMSDWLIRAQRPQQYFNVMGSLEGEDAAYGRYLDAQYQVERRYPFRDRDLAEFMLAIPADQLFAKLTPRPIVRRAYATELPPEIAARRDKTDFTNVIAAGVQGDRQFARWLTAKSVGWTDFVNKGYFGSSEGRQLASLSLKWRCAYYEYWKTVCYTSTAENLGY